MEQVDKLSQLSHDVLILSRNTLLVNLRFLDSSLSRLNLWPHPQISLATDGRHIVYDPVYILKSYKAEQERPVRDYLHMVLHCVFRHMFVSPTINQAYWNLACDIAVEAIITELSIRAAAAGREMQQKAILQSLTTKIGTLTAEKLYRYFADADFPAEKLLDWRSIFLADDHDIWYMHDPNSLLGQSGTTPSGDSISTQAPMSRESIVQDWKIVAERMQVDMEMFGKQRGRETGSLTQNLREVNREKYDYTAFLKKFAVMGEAMKINDDEFDYIFYTYGLQLYDNMPLVEPLEYKEVKRIKEFVIAIDTSGSVSGELVQTFVQKTYNVLKSTESFFAKINLHIIQCDADIQEIVKITSQEEFDKYLKGMTVKGLGGTDFRPVFEYVDNLVRQKEFFNLKGLIYFTDGYGEFPTKKPDYETAFVFVDDEYNIPEVPPWVIRLVLSKEDI